MTEKPSHEIARVDSVQPLEGKGPWDTKSGGVLSVFFNLPFEDIQERYFHYEPTEMSKLPRDIRGLRSYQVNNISKGQPGANEWHRLRNELVFCINGSFVWTCEDVSGNKRGFTLDRGLGVWVPPFILHTYEALVDHSSLLVIASTLFIPDDHTTHDTFSTESFHELQKHYS